MPAAPPAATEGRAFRFVQFEFPWALGPADGRYVVRDAADATPSHVLVLATLGAPERRRLRDRRARPVAAEPPPSPVTTARATVVDAVPVSIAEAERWLVDAGPNDAERALAQVARAVRAHRLASGDPAVHEPALAQALVVRAGHGAGEQVAEGRWGAARELPPARVARQRRVAGLQPQERLAALLGGHAHPLACEELTLRARHDLDSDQLREAALQLRAALDAALGELPTAPDASADMTGRLAELRERRPAVAALADDALSGALPPEAGETLGATLQRLEAALRGRIASTN
ncbi:MAG TPA: hypothetical protein VKB03_04505 [Conexibacter sp.]|nr:hypothetical protein [Conexibacter sp.]